MQEESLGTKGMAKNPDHDVRTKKKELEEYVAIGRLDYSI